MQHGNVEGFSHTGDAVEPSFFTLPGNRTSVGLPAGMISAVAGGALLVLPLLVVFAPLIAALFGFETTGVRASGIGLQAIASSGVLGGAALVGGLWAISRNHPRGIATN
jgi:hypothetical protein